MAQITSSPLTAAAAQGYMQAVTDFLTVLGAIETISGVDEGAIKAKSELAFYFLRSLARYSATELPLFAGWEEKGVDELRAPDDYLARVVNFIDLMERRRVRELPDPQPIRFQRVAQAIIKRETADDPRGAYLMQYDHAAGWYQFIGGRFRDSDEHIENTMIRELAEELQRPLQYPDDFSLELLTEHAGFRRHSKTAGVLSQYIFTFYHVQGLTGEIPPHEDNRWVPFTELIAGKTDDGRDVAGNVALMVDIEWAQLASSLRA